MKETKKKTTKKTVAKKTAVKKVVKKDQNLVSYEISEDYAGPVPFGLALSKRYKEINCILIAYITRAYKIPAKVSKKKGKYIVIFDTNDIKVKSIQKAIVGDVDHTKYEAYNGNPLAVEWSEKAMNITLIRKVM